MKNNENNFCAIVVTYNRKILLLECLKSLINQTVPIASIYLIDNASADGTPMFLKENGYINEMPPETLSNNWEKDFELKTLTNNITIHYVRMSKNTGGAGGFYEGVKRGYERGYKWLWLMDDDAEPKYDSLQQLVQYIDNNEIVALAPRVIYNNSTVFGHRGISDFKRFPFLHKSIEEEKYSLNKTIDIDFASFVGIMISHKAIKKIGFPKSDLFIHNDDVEYCLRLRTVGRILLVPESVIFHKEEIRNDIVRYNLFGKHVNLIHYDRLWLTYYGKRNLIWLYKKHTSNKLKFYFNLLIETAKSILVISLVGDHKLKRLIFLISSILDGLNGKFDNTKSKKILGTF